MKKTYNFYKWRIWVILSLSFVMSLFHRSALGVVSGDISSTLNLSPVQLANVASITFYSYAIMQIPAGMLLDLFGYKKISVIGIITTGVGSLLLGASINLWMAYGGRLLVGVGTSVIFISVLKAQSIWFSKDEFSSASSKLSFIGNLGGVIATFPLAMLDLFIGWRKSFYIMGIACFIIGILIHKFVVSNPKELGFRAVGINNSEEKINLIGALKAVITNSATWRNFFILFCLVGCTTTLTGLWGVSYFTNVYNISKTSAAFYTSFIIYGLVFGSLAIGKIDMILKDPNKWCPRISLTVNSLIWVYILIIKDGKPSLSTYPFILFVMGVFAMAHILSFTDIKEKVQSNYSGIGASIVNSGEFVGSSMLSLMIGYLLDIKWNGQVVDGVKIYGIEQYKFAFLIFLIVSLIGVFMSFIRDNKVNINETIDQEEESLLA